MVSRGIDAPSLTSKIIFFYLASLILLLTFTYSPSIEVENQGILAITQRIYEVINSTDETLNLFNEFTIFPNNLSVWLVGDPRYVSLDEGSRYRTLNSDIGYIRLLWGYGIIGSLVHYAFYLSIIFIACNSYSRYYSAKLKNLASLNIIFALAILALNYKEVFVLTRIGFSTTCILLFAMLQLIAFENKETVNISKKSHLRRSHSINSSFFRNSNRLTQILIPTNPIK